VSHAAGPMSLSLAADVATLSRRYDEAERLAAQGLGVSSAPELHLRLATALAGQGRLADAIEHVDPLLAEEPGLEELQLARGSFLRELAGEDPPSDRGSAVLRRFHDRSALDALFERLASFPSTAQP